MSEYKKELWLGEIHSTGGWNWEIRGVPKDDYMDNIKACGEFIEQLKDIIVYMDSLYEHSIGRKRCRTDMKSKWGLDRSLENEGGKK